MSAAKLKVTELRSQLALRGLDTTGNKPALVQRLEDAQREEEKALADTSVVGKKRGRDSEDGVLEKGSVVEGLQKMVVVELRAEATLRGLPTTGLKRELVERIAAVMEKDLPEVVNLEGNKKEKLVTATKKGGAVLDQWLPDHIKSSYHVLQHGGDIYDATLNQTNVGYNNNKFYTIQALESDSGGTFVVYNRWGRVGVKGQDKLHGPYTSLESAIDEFQMKFFAKTKNQWSSRKDFICYPKCYTWLEMDYSENGKETVQGKPRKSLTGPQSRESQLDPRVAQFISLICNISMMRQQMLEIGYNAEKLPLGKLSKSTILKGYDVLRRISSVIGQSDRKKLEDLSGEFYTVIPHDFGFKKMREFVIDTPYKLKCKLEMVEALSEIEIATKILMDDIEALVAHVMNGGPNWIAPLCSAAYRYFKLTVHGTLLYYLDDPLYYYYQNLNCDLTPVDIDYKEFSMIEKYLLNTHAKTHSNYTVNIVQIFKVSRKGEFERFKKFSGMKNRILLWHGSRLTNWTGILSQGLRIAPPEAPVTGYMFGKGVYFADMFSKSANYCFASSGSRTGVLLLCEVALGDMAELLAADYNADRLPEGKLSTKGVGATEPDSSEFQSLDDGVVVPLGKPKERPGPKGALLYNEYIVYNVEQIKMRYLVQVNFNFKP